MSIEFIPFSKPVRFLLGALYVAVGLSALGTLMAAFTLAAKPLWLLIGFESVVIVCMVLGIFGISGPSANQTRGQALGLSSLAFTLLLAGVLGYFSINGQFQLKGDGQFIGMKPWLGGRLAAAALIALIASFIVFTRNPKSLGYLIKALCTGVPLVLALGVTFAFRGQLRSMIEPMPTWIPILFACFAGLIAVALSAACGHFMIRAYEMGSDDERALTT